MNTPRRSHNFIDLTGQTFGRLRVVGEGEKNNGRTSWKCRCECGAMVTTNADNLKAGRTQSCGCLRNERISETHTIHGALKGGKETRTHLSWRCMMARCYYKRSNRYKHYGQRGITVCARWHYYSNFLADMGERPARLTLDRKDTNGNYNKDNCRWTTQTVQQNNRRNNVSRRSRL